MRRNPLKQLSSARLVLLLIWLVLVGLFIERELLVESIDPAELQAIQQAESEEYLSILFRQQRIGYAIYRYLRFHDGWKLEQEAAMKLTVGKTVHPIRMSVTASLSDTGLLRNFSFSFTSPYYAMDGEGRVDGTTIHYTLNTGSSTIRDSLQFQSPPILPGSRRGYLLNRNPEIGQKIKIPWFDPVTLSGRESTLEYRGRQSLLINGRVEKLHHFIETSGGIRASSWLDDRGKLVKEESPAGFVFLRQPKFKVLAELDMTPGTDLLNAVAVHPSGPLVFDDKTMRYRLKIPDGANFELDGGRQRFVGDSLEITAEALLPKTQLQCSASPEDLAATPYIQAEAPEIVQLASELTADSPPPLEQVRTLATWVYEHLEKRPVLGLPDALTTLKSKRGDCNEHASLFAAMARSVGLPTRIAAGVVFARGSFYYHAWNEVCVDGGWLSLDTTTNQIPADLSHIRFLTGELQDQLQIGSLLGTLQIEILPRSDTPPPATTKNMQ